MIPSRSDDNLKDGTQAGFAMKKGSPRGAAFVLGPWLGLWLHYSPPSLLKELRRVLLQYSNTP